MGLIPKTYRGLIQLSSKKNKQCSLERVEDLNGYFSEENIDG